MKLVLVYHLVILVCLIATSILVSSIQYAKSGCKDMCGNVMIPYPFGIGTNCAVNEWYVVDCNSSTPYLSALKNFEVLSVKLEFQTVTIKAPMISDCQNTVRTMNHTLSVDLGRSPFILSKPYNKLVVEGCGNAIILDQETMITAGCSTSCVNDTTFSERDNCFGINYC